MSQTSLRIPSHAKINLWLRVMGKRPDGFHTVQTRMCPISLADEVHLSLDDTQSVRLTCSDPTVPTDETNLALKALRAFERHTGRTVSCAIHLEKRIPHGAGLGGGSSNAAAVLDGLNRLSSQPLDQAALHSLAAELGSDVPFFLLRQTCDASGRGEIVTPVPDFEWKLPLVLIKPPFGISTPWAYQHWASSKPLHGIPSMPQTCPWGDMINDLERPVFEKWVMLPALKSWLLQQPETKAALMSGSGSTMFAITHSASGATELSARAREFCGPTSQLFTAETL